MPKCSFKKCKNNTSRTLKKDGISYFRFPRDPVRCGEWISVIVRQQSGEYFKPTPRSVVCSQHFLESDEYMTMKGFKRLHKTAVPRLEQTQSEFAENSGNVLPGTSYSSVEQRQSKLAENSGDVSEPGTSYSSMDQTKILIAKLYRYFEQEYEELKMVYGDLDLTRLSDFCQRTALATGVSEAMVMQVLEEERRNEGRQREAPQKERAARKRRRETTHSSSEEDSSDDNVVETLVVKIEPPEYNIDEPEIFLPAVKEPRVGDTNKKQADPIALEVKSETHDDENDTEEPEIFVPAVKVEPSDDDTNKKQRDPIALDIKLEQQDDDDELENTDATPASETSAATIRKAKKIPRLGDATSVQFVVRETPLLPPRPASPSQYRRNLGDADVLEIRHHGSDLSSDEGDDDDEEDVVFPRMLTRTLQSVMETPLDEDYDDGSGDLTATEPEEPAAAAAEDVPPTATDQPRRWFDFEWKQFPNPPVQPETRRETFSQRNVGPTTPRDDPFDVFIDIWDRPIMEHIASETNKYAQLVAGEADNLHPSSRMRRWRPTDPEELYTFFGLLLAMGVVVKSRLEEYWSATPDIFVTPGFSAYMSINRFILLSKCLHFNSSIGMCALERDNSEARLFKIQPILSHLNKKFQELYTPSQNIALDESLLMWKGWLDIGQFIPNEAAKRGIKSYEICESQTGYLWRFEIHADKRSELEQFEDPMEEPTPSIVLRLTQGLEHKGYTLWMDNFYNSPCLARRLKSLGFDCAGTLRTDRLFVPQALYVLTKWDMLPRQATGVTSGDVDIMVWRDNNRVATISTYHGNFVQKVEGTIRPTVICDYNIMMGGVDKKDQLLAMYPVERKRTMVWYKKLFLRLLNVSVLNSFIIHHHHHSLTHRNFRMSLIKSLLSRHRPLRIPFPTIATTRNPRLDDPMQRNREPFSATEHRIDEYDVDPNNARRPRRLCIICKKMVQSFCVGCNKALCMKYCFQAHHTI